MLDTHASAHKSSGTRRRGRTVVAIGVGAALVVFGSYIAQTKQSDTN